MELKNYNVYFFFVLLSGISLLVYFLIKPFLVPFLIAAILAHLFRPAYLSILRFTGQRQGISSLLTCLLIAFIIITPAIFISSLIIKEVKSLVVEISSGGGNLENFIFEVNTRISSFPFSGPFGASNFLSEENILAVVKSFSQNTLNIIQSTYRGIAHFIFVTFIMFFSLFYLFIDGERLVKTVMRLSPLRDKYEKNLIAKFNSIVRATLKGTTLIAILQGTLGGLLFAATGVASPVLFGLLMTISSVIPSVGSGLVWAPMGLIMIILGNFTQGIIILLFGALFISTIDNLIRPKLVGRDTQMHPLMILFSTLGGIALFGISGFIVGPILMSLFVALWDIYSLEFKKQLDNYNT